MLPRPRAWQTAKCTMHPFFINMFNLLHALTRCARFEASARHRLTMRGSGFAKEIVVKDFFFVGAAARMASSERSTPWPGSRTAIYAAM